MSSSFEAVHEGQQLGDHSSFNLSVHFLSVGGNGVNLIDEDDGWAVFLSFLEGLAEVAFCLAGHLGHDLRAVDEEEECASFVGDSTGN